MAKYKLTWRDLSWKDFKIYLFSLFKAFIPKTKISNLDELEDFIQSKSAWVTQVTLYGYLKTRMGTRYVLHFENDEFMASVNLLKFISPYSVVLTYNLEPIYGIIMAVIFFGNNEKMSLSFYIGLFLILSSVIFNMYIKKRNNKDYK